MALFNRKDLEHVFSNLCRTGRNNGGKAHPVELIHLFCKITLTESENLKIHFSAVILTADETREGPS